MKELQAQCGGCGRPAKLPVGSAAGRRCMYCGGELVLDAASAGLAAAQAQAVRAAEPRKTADTAVVCPFCARRLMLKAVAAGDFLNCSYCSAPFIVPGKGGTAVLAAKDRTFRGDAAEDTEAMERLGLSTLKELSAQSGLPPSDILDLAANGLCWRLARGHASEAEARDLAAVLCAVASAEAPSGDGWVCPLPPLWTGELVARVILSKRKADLSRKGDELVFVKVETGVHFVRADGSAPLDTMQGVGEALKDAVIEAAIDQGIQALSGGQFGYNASGGRQAPEVAIRHFFRADILPVPGGSKMGYSHEWATGERKDFEEVHREIMREVGIGLMRRVEVFAALKALFGEWFTADAFLCLKEDRLKSWLASLSPHLGAHAGAPALCSKLK